MSRSTDITDLPVTAPGDFRIGGGLRANRLGYGTMQIIGSGYWGPPRVESLNSA
ncbi:hypothetical protein [Streptomyces sp. NPDC060205]|uniref:hypothetical protein n=1 Tax=Streptomyces sp. NPDC060205 TaxID=3347072 RepID=UPI00365F346D